MNALSERLPANNAALEKRLNGNLCLSHAHFEGMTGTISSSSHVKIAIQRKKQTSVRNGTIPPVLDPRDAQRSEIPSVSGFNRSGSLLVMERVFKQGQTCHERECSESAQESYLASGQIWIDTRPASPKVSQIDELL